QISHNFFRAKSEMDLTSEGISEAASSPSLCDFRRCAAAGDAHFRLPPDDGSSSVDAFNADTPLSCKRSPDRSRKTYKLTRFSTAEVCLTPDLQQAVVRSRSAVDSRPRSESSVVSSLNEKATASRRTHCFFESIFLRSLPVTPAREVSHNLLLESCTPMPTPVETDRPVIKTVRKHWCIVFCSSTPAQVLPSPRSYLVPSNLDCPCKHHCIDCHTGDAIDWPSSEQNILQKCSSMTRRVNRSFRYALQQQITRVSDDPSPVLAVEFKEEFNLQLELLYQQPQSWQSCAESTSESIYLQPAVSRREKVLFYCELSDCDETVTDWQMAAFYKLKCHPMTARCIREKPTASSDWRMEQWRIQCNEPQCAPLTEVLHPALHYSSGASTGDCGCTTDCQQMKPQWPPAPDPHSSHRTRDSDCCTSVSYSNVHSAPERRVDKRWRQRRRAPLDSPSASAVSTQSAETESAVLHTAIARGGFDHLLQTLERARLRYSGSAVSATFSCPGTGSGRRRRRQQSKACSFQTCPATCDLGLENDRNELEIEDEDVEESELENTQVLDGNQSNFEDNDCSDEFCACDTQYCSCNFRTCCCEGDYQCNDGLAEPSVQPLIDHSTASQRERREAKIIDSMSQSLLTLTKSLESCVRHIRGTVAELQRL
ncbi:hypothetical protein BOX15_Mlig012479g1, partial [Macrostomum lignano]